MLRSPGALLLAFLTLSCGDSPSQRVDGEVKGVSLENAHGSGELYEIGTFSTSATRSVVLRSEVGGCGHSRARDGEHKLVMLFRVQPASGKPQYITPGTYSVGEQSTEHGSVTVTVYLETSGEPVAAPRGGQIALETLENDRASGSFSFRFDDDEEFSGDFDVPVCLRE